MEQPEVEKLVGELELGVDRLRSLYEQYFMGIEKLEPTVPRKDVDRRIHVLRKEQIRNTALRFRFQMIIQRYNTYQTHWQRICREIENGTYKRHVMRANRRFDSDRPRPSAPPARRSSIPPRLEQAAAPASVPAPLPPPSPPGFPQPGSSLPAELAAELAELEREFGPVLPTAPQRFPAPAPVRPPAAAPPKAPPARPAVPAVPPAPVPPLRPAAVAPPVAAKAAGPPPPPAARPLPFSPAAGAPPRPQAPPPEPARTAAPPPASPPAARPPAIPPAAAARPPAQAPDAPRPPTRSDVDLSDQRVRALYQQYVDAKRRQKESTAALTFEAVARSLRESSAKLREKHGKAVDFEVAIKDGKAILKPVLK